MTADEDLRAAVGRRARGLRVRPADLQVAHACVADRTDTGPVLVVPLARLGNALRRGVEARLPELGPDKRRAARRDWGRCSRPAGPRRAAEWRRPPSARRRSTRRPEVERLAAKLLLVDGKRRACLGVQDLARDLAPVDPQRERQRFRGGRPDPAPVDADQVLAVHRKAMRDVRRVGQAQPGAVVRRRHGRWTPRTCAGRHSCVQASACAAPDQTRPCARRARRPAGSAPSAPATPRARRRCCRSRTRNRPAESRRPG